MAEAHGAVIHAIAAGRKAASSIDKALGGSGDIEEALFERDAPGQYLGRHAGFAFLPREKVPELDLEQRHRGFEEISLGYTDAQARREAGRCLQCDLRLHLRCNPSPPKKGLPFKKENVLEVPEEEGVYRLFDSEHHVLAIKGTANIRKDLFRALHENEGVEWFDYEPDKMYSRRESELIQKHLQEHGKMPGGGPDEELF